MDKCSICKNELSENSNVLFVTDEGNNIKICDLCEKLRHFLGRDPVPEHVNLIRHNIVCRVPHTVR